MLTAGTSDGPVAAEVAATLAASGVGCRRVDDVGVAGLHRVLAVAPELAAADAVVVVAGMDGALPGVVAGLTDRLVVAVPTSVGYGAAFEGLAALLTMLTACAPGVLVVNIDNGFGAGVAAAADRPPVGSAVADGVGQQLVHRARTGSPAGPPRRARSRGRRRAVRARRPARRPAAASTSTRATSPRGRARAGSRTASPAAASAPAGRPRPRSTRASPSADDRHAVGDPAGQAGGRGLVGQRQLPAPGGGRTSSLVMPARASGAQAPRRRRRGCRAGSRRSGRRRWCR